ncbi:MULTISPECIES: hypothetical protein [Sphingosinicellaceae]|uniref:hypothetical protein n=1 Tax=Sphingosinicellaceae TaxID=2820280 RepID=UPI001C1E1D55|nr:MULTISPECIES: hypothetical protein [Polymorphobacter]QYE36489.1 hypothetical protein KZX46_11520 [Polymorphobacter sp. PAMC 29334]UAJ10018.1 hypothetical protein KTC28_17350 [Polymorphobacter megasporae]
MKQRLSSSAAIAGLAAVMWIVPSVGTQGMGTIGQRFIHPDTVLVDPVADTDTARQSARITLQAADSATETALGY